MYQGNHSQTELVRSQLCLQIHRATELTVSICPYIDYAMYKCFMQVFNHSEMKGGWFVGDFDPCVFKTESAEVGVKTYQAGETNAVHYHKHSTEVTMVVSGEIGRAHV